MPLFLTGCIPSANNTDKNIENNPIDVRPEGWQPATSTEEVPEFDTSKPDGTPRKLLNSDFIQTLGWKASTQLSEGIKSTYQWYKHNQL